MVTRPNNIELSMISGGNDDLLFFDFLLFNVGDIVKILNVVSKKWSRTSYKIRKIYDCRNDPSLKCYLYEVVKKNDDKKKSSSSFFIEEANIKIAQK